jgi:hypothetical protein
VFTRTIARSTVGSVRITLACRLPPSGNFTVTLLLPWTTCAFVTTVSGVTKKPLPRPDAVSMSTTAAIALLTTSSSEDGAATGAGAAIVAAGGTGMGSAMAVAGEDGIEESGFAGAFAAAAVCAGPTSLAGFMKNHTAPPPATAAAITRIPHGVADGRDAAMLAGTE